MSKHAVSGQTTDEIFYADFMTIDEAGLDLTVAGETVLAASFANINPFQLAYEVLPEDFELMQDVTKHEFEESVQTLADDLDNVIDEDLEQCARVFLTALARRNGYEK